MHLESTKLLPDEFARLVLPLGTTAVVADPHELANVLGTDGVHWLLDACEGLPLDFYFMALVVHPGLRVRVAAPTAARGRSREPSATPPRARARGDDELPRRHRRRRVGARQAGACGSAHVDGHAPGVLGRELNAYAAAGIRSDHEALTAEEGRERLRAGMWLLIREASMARNLLALLPLVAELGTNQIAFCTDDRDPEDISENGHLNGMVREAVAAGIRPEDALVLASYNPAVWHRLWNFGAIAPGYSGRSARPARPGRVPARRRAEEGPRGRGDRAARGPGVGQALGADQAGLRGRLPVPWTGGRSARSGSSKTRS